MRILSLLAFGAVAACSASSPPPATSNTGNALSEDPADAGDAAVFGAEAGYISDTPCTPWFTLGDGTTCISSNDLEVQATATCAMVTNAPAPDPFPKIEPATTCDGGATLAYFMCCPTKWW